MVLLLGGSPFILGVTTFCRGIPQLVVAPIGGALSDRFERRSLVFATQVGAAALAFGLAGLVTAGYAQVWHVIVFALLTGTLMAVNMPAAQALIYDAAGREDLTNAVVLNSVAFNVARVLGPVLGGLAIVALGVDSCFYLIGASNLAAGIVLLRWTASPRVPTGFRSFFHQFAEGMSYLGANSLVLALLLVEIVMEVFPSPTVTAQVGGSVRRFGVSG